MTLTYDHVTCSMKDENGSIVVSLWIAPLALERDSAFGHKLAAAPDLLAALEALSGLDRTPDKHARPEILNARAAIARATPQQGDDT
jgi:hypothetical protein